jgi:RNA polymerase sigma-70 factor (ECF subfamily)
VALRILGDSDIAADAVQETLLSAFRKIDTFRGESIKHWLARIMVNACYDELRRQHRQRTIPLERVSTDKEEMEPGLWLADPNAAPEERCEYRELENMIATCLQSIAPNYRTILVLVDVEDRSYEETAAILGIPINTVKSRLARARMKMREELHKFKNQFPAHYRIGFSQKVRAGVPFSA